MGPPPTPKARQTERDPLPESPKITMEERARSLAERIQESARAQAAVVELKGAAVVLRRSGAEIAREAIKAVDRGWHQDWLLRQWVLLAIRWMEDLLSEDHE